MERYLVFKDWNIVKILILSKEMHRFDAVSTKNSNVRVGIVVTVS